MPSIREKLADKRTKLAGGRERIADHPADVNHYEDGSYRNVPVDLVRPNPSQPRQFFDPESLGELAESIRQKGVLQPILVQRGADGEIFLVAGERRLRAAKMAGLKVVPAILTKGNAAEIALIENLQREDLKPVEEAEALARMVREFGYTQEQLARVIGKARSTVTESLSLTRLPEAIKEECRRADTVSRRALVEVAKQESAEEMVALFRRIRQGNLKSDEVRGITRRSGSQGRGAPLPSMLHGMDRTQRLLRSIDPSTLTAREKAALSNGLRRLQETIEDILRNL